jgi:hypothetical protein
MVKGSGGALPLGAGSQGEAYAASAWQSVPLTNPIANCRRYFPRGMWFTSLAMTAALCFTATSMAWAWGLVVSLLSKLTPSSLMEASALTIFPLTITDMLLEWSSPLPSRPLPLPSWPPPLLGRQSPSLGWAPGSPSWYDPAFAESSSCVLPAFMVRPDPIDHSANLAAFSVSLLTTSATVFPACQIVVSSA